MSEHKALSAPEQIALQEEVVELRAMVNELRETLFNTVEQVYDNDLIEDAAYSLMDKVPHQSLHDHDLRIAEKVRNACAEVSSDIFGGDYHRTKIISGKEQIMKLDLEEIIEDA